MYLDSSKLSDALFRSLRTISKAVKDPKAVKVLDSAELGFYAPFTSISKDLLTYAYINKVLSLLLLRDSKYKLLNKLRHQLILQRRRFLTHLKHIAETLDMCHINYVIFKTVRPVPETPVDIDVLVESQDEAFNAVACLRKRFHIEIWGEDRYSIGIRIPEFGEFVDFYVKPHVADLVYLESKALIKNRAYLHVDELGVEIIIPVPRPELEFCSILAHSVVKEGLVTLNDVISLTAYKILSDSDELAKWLSKFSLIIAYNIFIKTLEKEFPARINYDARFAAIVSMLKEKYVISSLPYFMLSIINRIDRAVEQMRKVTYVRGFGR